jgi:hypothetical protein
MRHSTKFSRLVFVRPVCIRIQTCRYTDYVIQNAVLSRTGPESKVALKMNENQDKNDCNASAVYEVP